MYSAAATAAADAALCVAVAAVAAAAVLRHRVPDGQTCCWLIDSDPSAFLLFVQA